VGRGHRGRPALYFEGFRSALADAPAGLLRAGPPADPAAIAAAEQVLGRPLPHAYDAFLRSFDGADMFHESLVVYGVGPRTFRGLVPGNEAPGPLLHPGELVIAEGAGGDRLALSAEDEARVFRLRAGSEERWLAGSSFPRWLEAAIAREAILYDHEGEFRLEAFEEDGEELTPTFALRQAERALKKDPGSAESHHDLGVASRRLGRLDRAREAFAEAATLDPENPWPAFDHGRTALALDSFVEAAEAFRRAAAAAPGAEGARFVAWAARAARQAGDLAAAEALRREAEARDPALPSSLRRAFEAAADDEAARVEAEALLSVFEPSRRRLPLIEAAGEPPAKASRGATRPPSRPRR
jgi:hypothetical protein